MDNRGSERRQHDKGCGTDEDLSQARKSRDGKSLQRFLEEGVPNGLSALNTEVWEWLSVGHIRNWAGPFGFLGSFHSLILWLTLVSEVRIKLEFHFDFQGRANEPEPVAPPPDDVPNGEGI